MKFLITFLFTFLSVQITTAQKFKVLAFYTGKNDLAHISFVKEANTWFGQLAKEEKFSYNATSNWDSLNTEVLKSVDIVLFLDTRPEKPAQREAFENYMKNGGAWLGFHFSAFAMDKSDFPQNWNWYHNEFLGSGQYEGNTWRPTSAILKIEKKGHPSLKKLEKEFTTSPNEWYSWEHDLRQNPDIDILLAISEKSYPLGTGPKNHEIWYCGYYPVMWTNKKYKMAYINMGHNDMDYEGGTNATLSYQFANQNYRLLITNTLLWLGKK